MEYPKDRESITLEFIDINLISREDVLDMIVKEGKSAYLTEDYFRDKFFKIGKQLNNLRKMPRGPKRAQAKSICCEIFSPAIPWVGDPVWIPVAEGFLIDVPCFAICGIKSVEIRLGRLLGMPPGKWGIDEPLPNIGGVIDVAQSVWDGGPYTMTSPLVEQSFTNVAVEQSFAAEEVPVGRRGWYIKITDNCGNVIIGIGLLPQ